MLGKFTYCDSQNKQLQSVEEASLDHHSWSNGRYPEIRHRITERLISDSKLVFVQRAEELVSKIKLGISRGAKNQSLNLVFDVKRDAQKLVSSVTLGYCVERLES